MTSAGLRIFDSEDFIYIYDDTEYNDGYDCLKLSKVSPSVDIQKMKLREGLAKTSVIFGIIGLSSLSFGQILVVVKSASPVAIIKGKIMQKVDEVQAICLDNSKKNTKLNKYACMLENFFNKTPNFYFSKCTDIFSTLQKQNQQSSHALQFVWNSFLLKSFIGMNIPSNFTLRLLHGFVGQFYFHTDQGNASFTLISRRSASHHGTRFFYRGINENGCVANYVETESIISLKHCEFSHVQIRGSIPVKWSQMPTIKYMPPIELDRNDRFDKTKSHYEDIKKEHGRCISLNLIDQRKREKKLGETFQSAMAKNGLLDEYIAYDFHHECKNMNWKKLELLISSMSSKLITMGYFKYEENNLTSQFSQNGVVRTNCIDCLDRTNVVQSMISLFMFKHILHSNKICFTDFENTKFMFDNLWADNADIISIEYSGTPAMKTDFTRTGKRTYLGMINDGLNSAKRYAYNNFYDGYRQDLIDLSLGLHPVYKSHLKEVSSSPSSLYLIPPCATLVCLLLMFYTLFTPTESLMKSFKQFSFFTTFMVGCLAFITNNHTKYISYSQRQLSMNSKTE